ncbi:hypothetical protein EYR40_006432 [Pleurotus pulmonarius]|nr:hypothetical protein EYR40_006432 [Pleurotus pulmonarius]
MAAPKDKSIVLLLLDGQEGAPDSELHELINSNSAAYERTGPSTDPSSLPGRYALLTSNTPGAGHDEDFEKFYDEENIELVAKVPGWLRSRYKLEDYSGANTTESTSAPGKYLAGHEFERQGFVQAPEMGATIKTPWAERILKVVTVEFVKVFEKQGV